MQAPQESGPLGSARAVGGTLLALLRVRAELIALELKEQTDRGKRLVVLAFVAAAFLFAGLLLAALFVVVAFWDTWRLQAMAAVTLAYAGIGAWALLRIRTILASSPPPFSATLQEFESDLAMLKGRDEQA
jgi:uncharacterized membrane protein YqjE